MKISRAFLSAMLCAVFFLAACGPGAKLDRAQGLEKKGYYVEAGQTYEEIAGKYPKDPIAPEALYRVGRIYQNRLKLYSQAGSFYKRLLDAYPAAIPWAALAKRSLLDSPDYFPLTKGSFWIEGDSETKGTNMRSEWNCAETSTGTYRITRRISAGSRFVSESKRFYRKENYEVREYASAGAPGYTVILSYPYYEGKKWKQQSDGRSATFTIVSRGAALKVKAGEFANCLKVSEENSLIPGSIKYNYYAPGVGWVLTTTASAGGREHKNTELISYRIVPEEMQ